MSRISRRTALLTCGLALIVPAAVVSPSLASGVVDATGDRVPIFDFTDAYYAANGVGPAKLNFRPTGTDGISVVDDAPAPHLRDVRTRLTLPAYDHSGNRMFHTVLADLSPRPFTPNAAGRAARQLAEQAPVYVFPARGSDPTGVANSRQASVIDMRHGYFSNNPLGLWVHVFVNWTPKAFDTAAGRNALNAMARRNGRALDGTPILRTVSDIDEMVRAGYATKTRRPTTVQGRWFVCPVFKDPRDGAITEDAFLATVRRADGTPLPAERIFVTEFEALRITGDYPG
jgi:hypothetical protein